MPDTLQLNRRLPLASFAVLAAVWGCRGDTITGPSSRSGATPEADIAPTVLLAPTLTGEDLAGTGRFVQRGNCLTGSATATFAVRGPALGPYTGTFIEIGRLVIQEGIADFESAFVIYSPAGLVTGRKTLVSVEIAGGCGPDGRVVFGNAAGPELAAHYTATIRTQSGTFRDAGSSEVELLGSSDLWKVGETFISDGTATVPVSLGDDD